MSPSRRPGKLRGNFAWEFCGCNCKYCGMPSRAPRRWRGGAMGTSRPTATGPHHGAREYRTMPSRAPRQWRGGAMGTSRPTATGPRNGTAPRGTTTGRGRCARNGTAPRGDCGKWAGIVRYRCYDDIAKQFEFAATKAVGAFGDAAGGLARWNADVLCDRLCGSARRCAAAAGCKGDSRFGAASE